MAFKFGINNAGSSAPKPIEPSRESAEAVAFEARKNEAQLAAESAAIAHASHQPYNPVPESIDDLRSEDVVVRAVDKLDRLVADDFPFDPSQLEAIYGMVNQRYACLIGAAGTGKTTSTKKFVDLIKNDLGEVNMQNYWRKPKSESDADDMRDSAYVDPDDDYEIPEEAIPAICLVGFTGRSTQMIKKNFPRSWHGNIMTIHRMLGFAPEWYEDFDDESGAVKNKMRFVPTYTANLQLPWDIIIIDEAGMVSLDLWELVWAAAKPGCRIYMIGDINQLPPVHGRSVFGFAMTRWPTFELTHIHRQVGANNSIVDAAHSILKGQMPKSDGPKLLSFDGANGKEQAENTLESLKFLVGNKDWKFAMVKLPDFQEKASQALKKVVPILHKQGFYDSERDCIITPTNGHSMESMAYYLGQIHLNESLAMTLNPDATRFIIDSGRDRKRFAVGDKVMATKNDHQAGITNGMTGIIVDIVRNGDYAGDWRRFGPMDEVNAYIASTVDDDDHEDLDIEQIAAKVGNMDDAKKIKEQRDRGPASHTVVVRFGEGHHAIEQRFVTLAEVDTLQTAYVVTCHKMQGGEAPLIMGIVHSEQRRMLNREWLYTMVTRASGRCIMFYTDLALKVGLTKQEIKGQTLFEKIQFFKRLASDKIGDDDAILPARESFASSVVIPDGIHVRDGNVSLTTRPPLQKTGIDLKGMLTQPKPAPSPEQPTERVTIHVKVTVQQAPTPKPVVRDTVDGGDLTPKPAPTVQIPAEAPVVALPAAPLLLEDKRIIDYTDSFFERDDMRIVTEPFMKANAEIFANYRAENLAAREAHAARTAALKEKLLAAAVKPGVKFGVKS